MSHRHLFRQFQHLISKFPCQCQCNRGGYKPSVEVRTDRFCHDTSGLKSFHNYKQENGQWTGIPSGVFTSISSPAFSAGKKLNRALLQFTKKYSTPSTLSIDSLLVRAPNIAYMEGSTLTTKRIVRRKRTKDLPPRDQEVFDVLAYATADKYNLRTLKKDLLNQGLYQYQDLPSDLVGEAINVEAIYGIEDESRYIFFFKDGSVVFWNMPEVERNSVLKFVKRHQEGSYDADMIREEFEHIEYLYTGGQSRLQGDEIHLSLPNKENDPWELRLERYAFSNALSLSVKLAIWEAMLDQYVDSIEYVLQDLKSGKKIRMSEMDVLRKAGWLLHLRHLINLRSDLLDPPDAYWDREQLEVLYNKTYAHLDIARRTKVMNEKLTHCCELTNMLQDILKDKHHTRLEWMIIILIMIEVVFEFFHTYERRHASEK